MSFDSFRSSFNLVSMRRPPNHSDELLLITEADGRLTYHAAPVSASEVMMTPTLPVSEESADKARYLWVIDQTDVPHALEQSRWAKTLATGRLKHSNLTGGAEAYFGGEIWFWDERSLIVNFCSGRYGARELDNVGREDEAKMMAAVQALTEDGYRVATTGRDEESGFLSSPILLGAPVWQSADDGT